MGPEPRDELHRFEFEELYLEPLPDLRGDSCRDRLAEMIEDRWTSLARLACRERNAASPSKADALCAFDAIKHRLIAKDFDLLSLSLPELWRAIKSLSLRDWLKALSIAVVIVSTIAGVAFWAGAKFGK